MSAPSTPSSIISAFVSLYKHPPAVMRTLRLLVIDDCTIPFVVRYRQEATGGASGTTVGEWLDSFRQFQDLKKRCDAAISELEKREDTSLTTSLRSKFNSCASVQEFEDLWLPFRKERSSRAQKAAAMQLEPIALRIWSQSRDFENGIEDRSLLKEAKHAILREPDLRNQGDFFAAVNDILAHLYSTNPDVRGRLRKIVWSNGVMHSKLRESSASTKKKLSAKVKKKTSNNKHGKGRSKVGVYDFYDDFGCNLRSLLPHQTLALERGAREKVLTVTIKIRPLSSRHEQNSSSRSSSSETPEQRLRRYIVRQMRHSARIPFQKGASRRQCEKMLDEAAADAWSRLVRPALFREARKKLIEIAEVHAISCFASNLSSILLQPPLPPAQPGNTKSVAMRTVLGIDPGFRAGCKLAVVDAQGRVLETCTIYPHPPQNNVKKSSSVIQSLCAKHGVGLIAIGNGTASRETEALIGDIISHWATVNRTKSTSSFERPSTIIPQYSIVNEAGASVYSTSASASKEFGTNADPLAIGAVSIARRLQDPLSELVKIPPQSIGVGMYQHDVSEKRLTERLQQVVSNVVSDVGVRVNSASLDLLQHVSGLNVSRAKKIYEHVRKLGPLRCRDEILKVSGIGEKTYKLCAGFLRISGGTCPLDNTNVHPESYTIARKALHLVGCDEFSLVVPTSGSSTRIDLAAKLSSLSEEQLSTVADSEGVSLRHVQDIINFLTKPGALSDPRRGLPGAIVRSGPMNLSELRVGMKLPGTIRTVTSFGAFIDIGVGQDGLLHSKQIEKSKNSLVGAGSSVIVCVLDVDLNRKRISLGLGEQTSVSTDLERRKNKTKLNVRNLSSHSSLGHKSLVERIEKRKKGSSDTNRSKTSKSPQYASKNRKHKNSLRDRIVARKKKGSDKNNRIDNSKKRKRGNWHSGGTKQSKRFKST